MCVAQGALALATDQKRAGGSVERLAVLLRRRVLFFAVRKGAAVSGEPGAMLGPPRLVRRPALTSSLDPFPAICVYVSHHSRRRVHIWIEISAGLEYPALLCSHSSGDRRRLLS